MEYYKQVGSNIEKEPNDNSNLLTAKKAREMTNDAIKKKIQETLLPRIKNVAEKGKTNLDCDISTDIDYKYAISYIKYLGYEVEHVKTYSSCITINVKW